MRYPALAAVRGSVAADARRSLVFASGALRHERTRPCGELGS